MDFNTLYEIVAPYLGATGVGTLIVGALTIFFKCWGAIKTFIGSFKDTSKMIEDSIKKVIPNQMYVKIETVAKTEFAKMRTELLSTVEEKWVNQITENTELMKAIALALSSMKAIPDSQKKILAGYLEIKPKTTEALIIDLLPEETNSTSDKKETQKIIIE